MNLTDSLISKSEHSETINKIKFVLITLVVLDHNKLFRLFWPDVFEPLTFHVVGFFLLAFSFDRHLLSYQFIKDRVARYLVPFWWFLFFATVGSSLISNNLSITSVALNYISSALVGSAELLKLTSGLYMLWFLPCLFGLTCAIAFFDSIENKFYKSIICLVAGIMHFASPFLTGSWIAWIPAGLPIISFIFIIGLVWREIIRLPLLDYFGLIAVVVSIISFGILVNKKIHIEIGTFEISELKNLFYFLLHDLNLISSSIAIIWLSKNIKNTKWIEYIGKNSMLIYLIHPFIYFFVNKKIYLLEDLKTNYLHFISACAVTAFVIILSCLLSFIVCKYPLVSSLLVPKTWASWLPVAYFNTLKTAK